MDVLYTSYLYILTFPYLSYLSQETKTPYILFCIMFPLDCVPDPSLSIFTHQEIFPAHVLQTLTELECRQFYLA